MNEVDVLKRLIYLNIIVYLENFFEGRVLMIVMEYVQGGIMFSFFEEWEGKLLDEDEIIRLFV